MRAVSGDKKLKGWCEDLSAEQVNSEIATRRGWSNTPGPQWRPTPSTPSWDEKEHASLREHEPPPYTTTSALRDPLIVEMEQLGVIPRAIEHDGDSRVLFRGSMGPESRARLWLQWKRVGFIDIDIVRS